MHHAVCLALIDYVCGRARVRLALDMTESLQSLHATQRVMAAGGAAGDSAPRGLTTASRVSELRPHRKFDVHHRRAKPLQLGEFAAMSLATHAWDQLVTFLLAHALIKRPIQ